MNDLIASGASAPQRPKVRPVWALRGDDLAVADFISERIRADRACSAAIAGGATPRPILKILAQRNLARNRAVFVPTDERLVSPYNEASNYGLISKMLGRTSALIHPLEPLSIPPRFNFVWLGMAEDGKIASLFSSEDAIAKDNCPIIRTRPPPASFHAPFERVSLSLDALLETDETIVVIRGHSKRRLIEQAIEGLIDKPIFHLFQSATMPIKIFWST